MKKLYLLLILFFFSAQSFAQSCLFNCETSPNNIAANSEGVSIGKSIYKTITQGDPEIYEAQMILNRYHRYPVGPPNGQWTWETQSAIQRFYSDSDQSFNGHWSSKVLSDLKKRRLIVMPRSGSLSIAEKDEMYNQIQFQ